MLVAYLKGTPEPSREHARRKSLVILALLGVVRMQSAEGLATLPILLLALFASGHCRGVLLAAGSLHGVQR